MEYVINYLCVNWQGLLNVLKDLFSHGYYYYTVIELPIHKDKDWTKTDEKLINKYMAFYDVKSGRSRYYDRKKKGLANFRYIRWEHLIVILHTEGTVITSEKTKKEVDSKNKLRYLKPTTDKSLRKIFKVQKYIDRHMIEYEEKFYDIRRNPMFLDVSDEVSFNIQFLELSNPKKKMRNVNLQLAQLKKKKKLSEKLQEKKRILLFQKEKLEKKMEEYNRKNGTITVKFSKQFIREKKAELAEHVDHKNVGKLKYSFDMLNGIPSNHRGIIENKKQLRNFVLSHAAKHGLNLKEKDFYVKETQKPYGDKFVKGTKIKKLK